MNCLTFTANLTIFSDLPEIHKGERCNDGEVYRMECNTCLCKDNLLMCTKMGCDSFTPQKNPGRQKVKNHKKESKTEKAPSKKMLTVSDKEFWKLPSLPHHAAYCKPSKKYRVDCNVCICNKKKILVCDKKMCVDRKATRQIEAAKKSGQPCSKSDVSKKCLKCNCVKGKMKCEAMSVDKCQSEDEDLMLAQSTGSSRFSFDYKTQECIPDVVYRDKCNKCYCQPDRSLRCTKKMCLNYAQARQLEEQREYLVARGL